MTIQEKLTDARKHPENWDMDGLLLDAACVADQRDELLAACKKMIEWDEAERASSASWHELMDMCRESFILARAAIAKATAK